ncbi:MAG: hypothetical protein DWQ09_17860 [Proteobacteria bacterium]|nr:MAG: hypothetical protein DWQ09_17860 [Pseudomonadota bacterium]QKK11954.1 MAG: hypothetical protein HND59_10540 [Pseudomonadota bacterium]
MSLTGRNNKVLACALWLCALSTADAAPGRSCGTHWTGWGDQANPTTSPCPAGCERGERIKERTHQQGGKLLYDVQYECRYPPKFTGFPLIKGSPAEPGADKGAWLDSEESAQLEELLPEVRNAWEPSLRQLAKLIRQSPALADLGGYFPKLRVNVTAPDESLHTGNLYVQIWWPYAIETIPGSGAGPQLRIKGQYALNGPGGFSLDINRLPAGGNGSTQGLQRSEWYRDESGEFFMLPPAEREIAGFPVLAGYLWVTAPGKAPLFIPVSQERALQAAIAAASVQIQQASEGNSAAQEMLATYNSPEMKEMRRQAIEAAGASESDPKRAAAARAKAERDDHEQERQIREMAGQSADENPISLAVRRAVAEMETRLGAMTPAQRNAPAATRIVPEAFLQEEIVTAGTSGATPLMAYNPAFFDPKLAPSAMQLLVMGIGSAADWEDRDVPPQQQPVQIRVPIAIVEQTDWRQVAKLLK